MYHNGSPQCFGFIYIIRGTTNIVNIHVGGESISHFYSTFPLPFLLILTYWKKLNNLLRQILGKEEEKNTARSTSLPVSVFIKKVRMRSLILILLPPKHLWYFEMNFCFVIHILINSYTFQNLHKNA